MEKSLPCFASNRMLKKIKSWAVDFLHLQLVITLFSLPIFIVWGLPISMLSLFGNLLFSPLLVLFIGLCCLITFFEIAQIPYALFVQLLEWTSELWYKLLSLSNSAWLTGCSQNSLIIAVMACIVAYLFNRKYAPSKKKALFVLIFLLATVFITDWFLRKNLYFHLDHMHILQMHNRTICIDCGTFSKKRSPQSWIDYTLLSSLVQYTGKPHIDTFITFAQNKRTYHAAKLLERQAGVSKIIIPRHHRRHNLDHLPLSHHHHRHLVHRHYQFRLEQELTH